MRRVKINATGGQDRVKIIPATHKIEEDKRISVCWSHRQLFLITNFTATQTFNQKGKVRKENGGLFINFKLNIHTRFSLFTDS